MSLADAVKRFEMVLSHKEFASMDWKLYHTHRIGLDGLWRLIREANECGLKGQRVKNLLCADHYYDGPMRVALEVESKPKRLPTRRGGK